MRHSILIVEDDLDQLELLARWFSRAGYHVTAVHHPRQALAAATLRPFQFAIVDHALPRIDGIELTLRLRALLPDLHVVIAFDEIPAVPWVEAGGAQTFVIKPFTKALLDAMVEDVLEYSEEKTEFCVKRWVPALN